MNKKELSEELGLSLVTVSRYLSLGLPYEKVGNKYDFDLDEVREWINDNIDRRSPGQCERPPSKEEAIKWAFDMLKKYVAFMEKRLCKGCHGKFMNDIEGGRFGK